MARNHGVYDRFGEIYQGSAGWLTEQINALFRTFDSVTASLGLKADVTALTAEAAARTAAIAAEAAARTAADALLIPLTQKAAANGVATLGADAKIPGAQLPALAIGETFVVASQAAMLALTAQRGDVAVRTELNPDGFFLLTSDSPTTLADWVQITAPGAVVSVDGLTGAVDLSGTYVDKTTAQTIGGLKDFTTAPTINGAPITVADATAAVKGKLALTGDLGGTADIPTVPGLAKDVTSFAATAAQRALVGVDVLHPLSEFYATLALAQAAYPHATALTNSLDWAVWQAGVNATLSLRSGAANYFFATGESVTVRNNLSINCAGRQRTFFSTLNSYAFITPTNAPVDGVTIRDASFVLRDGSTSGGAIKAVGATNTPYHSAWLLERVNADGYQNTVSTSTDPLVHLDGWIGSQIQTMQCQKAKYGLKIESVGFASNAFDIIDFRGASCSIRAAWIKGCGQPRWFGGTIEACDGTALYFESCSGIMGYGGWFEENLGEHLVLDSCISPEWHGGRFQAHKVGSTSPHILISQDAVGGSALGAKLFAPYCTDAAGTGAKQIRLNAGVTRTSIYGPYINDSTQISDGGIETTVIAPNQGNTRLSGNITVNAGHLNLTNSQSLYFRNTQDASSAGWALLATPTSLTFRDDNYAVTAIAIVSTLTTPQIGFFGATPVNQPAANPDTTGATLVALETEVNQLKATLRSLGLLAT